MLVDQYGNPFKAAPAQTSRPMNARYDAERSTENHWAMADALSARAANSYSVRKRLRERARYEIANNSYARGIVNSVADYAVGSGPQLQLSYRGDDPNGEMRAVAKDVEKKWADWAYVRQLANKLYCMALAETGDGEAFALMVNSSRVSMHTPVQLDVRVIEADQFEDSTGAGWINDSSGVRLDAEGYPAAYAFMPEHPGDALSMWAGAQSDWISADQVIHVYKADRAGQVRGIPRITPALLLFAQLRRFTEATIDAAETAAKIAAILYGDEAVAGQAQPTPWDRIDLERNAFLTVPGGQRLAQLKAEHPNATYAEFVRTILREIARCLGLPAILALGDASQYNFSSAKADLMAWVRRVGCDRSMMWERMFLDRLLEQWLDEALLIESFLPQEFMDTAGEWSWQWMWPSAAQEIDRQKEAQGAQIELANNTTTLAREWAAKREDWSEQLHQRAREIALMRELGLTAEQALPKPSTNQQFKPDPTEDDSGDDTVDKEETTADA